MSGTLLKEIDDLGVGAYLMMNKWKVVGKRDRAVLFEIAAKDEAEFEQNTLDYLSSEFHRFDACLMSLKKMHGRYRGNSDD